jgi:hypothetical protein
MVSEYIPEIAKFQGILCIKPALFKQRQAVGRLVVREKFRNSF